MFFQFVVGMTMMKKEESFEGEKPLTYVEKTLNLCDWTTFNNWMSTCSSKMELVQSGGWVTQDSREC
jgi:hypothetical protein